MTAQQLQLPSHSSVVKAVSRIKSIKSLKNRRRKQPILREVESNKIIQDLLFDDPQTTTKAIARELYQAGYVLTQHQAKYRIKKLGFSYRRIHKVQVISESNRRRRINLRAWMVGTNAVLDQHIFVDESSILRGQSNTFCWVKEGEATPKIGQLRHNNGLHVFGGISYRGSTKLLIWDSRERMKANFYSTYCIENIVHEAGRRLYQGRYTLIQVGFFLSLRAFISKL